VVRQYFEVVTALHPTLKTKQSARRVKTVYPHTVTKGSVRVTIYRIVNPARGEVFEVTWFQGGTRKRKAFRDAGEALNQAEDTAKALDTGRGESLTLSGTDLESFRLATSAWLTPSLKSRAPCKRRSSIHS
jgi:hypothetical protein